MSYLPSPAPGRSPRPASGLPPSGSGELGGGGAFRVGRYLVAGELGRGGMGVVYRAHDPQLARDVAIKMVLDPERLDGPRRERLLREARAAARLRHAGIVAVHEVGEEAGRPYVVMDLVDGEPLDAVVRAGRLSPRRAAEIVRELAAALQHAHEQGIVHRDVKPGNVIVGRDGRPRLVDFGLARLTDAGSSITRTAELLGTPGYCAPEQARGAHHLVDARTDVFSLGAVLYHLLVGRSPFEGETVLEVLRRLFADDPEPPRAIDARIHPDLETVAMRCLEKEPDRRYPSAAAVADELGRFLGGEAISARPISRAARARRWARRNPARLAVVVLASLIALALPVAAVVHAVRTARVRERAAADTRAGMATAALEEAERAWARFAAGRDETPGGEGGREAPPNGETEPEAPRAETAEARRRRNDRLLALGLAAWGAGQRLEGVAPADPRTAPTMFRAAMGLGEVALAGRQWSLATSAFEKAASLGVDDARAARALDAVGDARDRLARGRRAAVEAIIERALDGRLRADGDGFDDALFELVRYPEAQTVQLLCGALDAVSDGLRASARASVLADAPPAEAGLAAAIEAWTTPSSESLDEPTLRAIQTASRRLLAERTEQPTRGSTSRMPGMQRVVAAEQERALGPDRLLLAQLACEALGRIGLREDAVDALARYLFAEQDETRAVSAAIALCRLDDPRASRLVVAAQSRFGANGIFWRRVGRHVDPARLADAGAPGPRTAEELVLRAALRTDAGDLAGALEDLDRAIALAPEDPNAWDARGQVRRRLGDFAGALADHGRAIEIAPTFAAAYDGRANTRHMMGEPRVALADHDEAIRLRPDHAPFWQNRAGTRRALGDLPGALADFTRALELAPGHALVWDNRGLVRSGMGDLAGALEDHSRALALDPDDGRIRAHVGEVQCRLGRLGEGLGNLDRAVLDAPDDPWVIHTRACARANAGDLEAAITDFDRVIALDPGHAQARYFRGLTRRRTGDAKGAIADLERFLELAPSHPFAERARVTLAELRGG